MSDFRGAAEIIKQTVSAIDAGRRFGLDVDRDGRCRCIFHHGENRNLKLYPSNGGYHCFVCHAHGTVIDLAMGVCGCDWREAVRILDDMFSLHLLDSGNRDAFERARRAAQERMEADRITRKRAAEAQERMLDAEERMRNIEFALQDYAPKQPGQPFSDEFVQALVARDSARAELDRARYAYEAMRTRA